VKVKFIENYIDQKIVTCVHNNHIYRVQLN